MYTERNAIFHGYAVCGVHALEDCVRQNPKRSTQNMYSPTSVNSSRDVRRYGIDFQPIRLFAFGRYRKADYGTKSEGSEKITFPISLFVFDKCLLKEIDFGVFLFFADRYFI